MPTRENDRGMPRLVPQLHLKLVRLLFSPGSEETVSSCAWSVREVYVSGGIETFPSHLLSLGECLPVILIKQ